MTPDFPRLDPTSTHLTHHGSRRVVAQLALGVVAIALSASSMQLSLSTPSTAVAEKQSLVRTPDEGAPSGVEHEPAADEAKLLVRWKQQVGAFLVFLVALMYVGSGVMIQLLFEELEFEKPFFFSFASVALCSCHLGFFSLLSCRAVCRRHGPPDGASRLDGRI